MIKKIHQIYISDNNVPPSKHINDQINLLKKMYFDYDYTLYNNDECRNIIGSLFGKKVVDLYDSLVPYAYRASFARYCILYKHGGQYFDISLCPEFKLEFNQTSILYEAPLDDSTNNKRAVCNGVMIFNTPQHPFLFDAIQNTIKNIKQKNYCDHALAILGPILLGKLQKYDITFGHSKWISPTQKAAFLNNDMHWKYRPDKTYLETFGCIGTNNYAKLWDSKQIFK
jgi:mannosyltransferase OCH1-like enzyme